VLLGVLLCASLPIRLFVTAALFVSWLPKRFFLVPASTQHCTLARLCDPHLAAPAAALFSWTLQGNMDSGVLFGSKEMIEQRVRETAKAAKDMGVRHVMNLGHGIMQVSDLGRNKQMFSWLLNISGSALTSRVAAPCSSNACRRHSLCMNMSLASGMSPPGAVPQGPF
jgi:hypothetical protein